MNLIGAVVVNLWVAGWMIATVRAGLKARAVELADPNRNTGSGSSSRSPEANAGEKSTRGGTTS